MRDPIITIHEFGKSRHQEYEAEVRPFWGQKLGANNHPGRAKQVKAALALSGAASIILVIAQLFVI